MLPKSKSGRSRRSRLRAFLDGGWDKAKGWLRSMFRPKPSQAETPTPIIITEPEVTTADKGPAVPTQENTLHLGGQNHRDSPEPSGTGPAAVDSEPSLGSSVSQNPRSPLAKTSKDDLTPDNGLGKPINPTINIIQNLSPLVTPAIVEPTATDNNGGPHPETVVSEVQSGEKVQSTCWEEALSGLTDGEREVLKAFGIDNTPDFETEVERVRKLGDSCTNKLSVGSGLKGTRIMPRGRVYGILKKMEEFAKIGDKVVQYSPEVVSLVWTGVRFCLQVALNDMQTFEAISSALDDIAGMMGSCRIYERIHLTRGMESSKAVVEQLLVAYTAVLKFMVEAARYSDEKYIMRLGKGVYEPFLIRIQPLLDDMSRSKMELERRARVGNDELQHEMNESQREEFKGLNHQLSYFRTDVLSAADRLLGYADKERQRKALEWLSPIRVDAHHQETKKLRFEGTGEWLFETRPFDQWVRANHSSVMWLYGKAGSGKTVLSSLVVDALDRTYKSVPIIYFYCYYGEKERRETSKILRTLLRQISALCRELDPEIMSAFEEDTFLTTEISRHLLEKTLSRFGKVFIVVDALDECDERERKSLVEILAQLQPKGCHVKTFLTSRFEQDLKRLLESELGHRIDADDTLKDIKPFVVATVDQHIEDGTLLDGDVSSALKEELVETLNKEADGMFLWVKYQLEYICEEGNEEGVRTRLKKLPRGLSGEDGTYSRIWTRITGKDSGDTRRKWALKTLKWLLHAKTPLSPQGILEATAIKIGSASFSPERKALNLNYLIQVCGGFVFLDEKLNVLRFVHYSVQEFLRVKEELNSAESVVAEVCFTVLGFEEDSYLSRDGNSIYRYATDYWEEHSKCWEKIDECRDSLIKRFLLDKQSFGAWNSTRGHRIRKSLQFDDRDEDLSLEGLDLDDFGFDDLNPHDLDPYQLTSYFNLPIILQHLLQQGSYDGDGWLLQMAARSNYTKVVQLLIDAGVDVNDKDGIALREASFSGHKEIVKLLLKAGADVNAQYGKALADAAFKGHKEIVKLLLEASSNVNTQDRKALADVVTRGHKEVVELLLEAGADVNAQYGGALVRAVSNGNKEIVKLLLEAGADANASAGEALVRAVSKGYKEIMKLLLEAGADVNAQDGKALVRAASRGREEMVKLLLEAGADANARAGKALADAALRGYKETVKLLLEAGADANTKAGKTLVIAAFIGHKETVKLLLKAGADANAQNGQALGEAAFNGHKETVELLLGAGADVNAGSGRALRWATTNGHKDIVQLLKANGAISYD